MLAFGRILALYLLLIYALNLNCRVKNSMLLFAHFGHFCQRVHWSLRFDMNCHCFFVIGDAPDVQIVHVDDVFGPALQDIHTQLI